MDSESRLVVSQIYRSGANIGSDYYWARVSLCGDKKMLQNYTVVMGAQLCDYTESH